MKKRYRQKFRIGQCSGWRSLGSGGCRTADRLAHSLTDIINTSTRPNVKVSALHYCGRSDSDEQ